MSCYVLLDVTQGRVKKYRVTYEERPGWFSRLFRAKTRTFIAEGDLLSEWFDVELGYKYSTRMGLMFKTWVKEWAFRKQLKG